MKSKKITLVFLIGLFFLLVSPKKVNAASNTLKLNHNSYVYNNKGKRIGKTVIKRNKKVKSVKKLEKISKEKRYFIFLNKIGSGVFDKQSLYWLPYKKIKNNYYYQIGENKYIKCANVKTIGESYVYTSETRIKIKKGWSIYTDDSKGKEINYKVKENEEYTVDREKVLPHQILSSYRIKGTNYWINVAYIESKPRQWLLPFSISKSPYAFITISKDNTLIYDASRNPQLNIILPSDPLVDYRTQKKVYIWNSVSNKAELYYQLLNTKVEGRDNINKDNSKNVFVKEGYIKVSNVKIEAGSELSPSNTPEQAKAAYEASLAK
ncbi:hypothetical protein FP435_07670 [Lactobacillus sp. PV037]|uniref:SLAP domain-containing protein n=1 Tax=unclassified Lactobacillus TaxID=2620435 RepID=UPI002240B12F|nr:MULTISPECIES: SLAP domain-containing protein [unclassified Lactobacillus]QNQ81650.1 hypothetical protein FP433_00585 [Lactobacillus sp. PV012]QNQ84303.1 hypothetical protein FP435_07670 [Lactobacillus sp. PV037]